MSLTTSSIKIRLAFALGISTLVLLSLAYAALSAIARMSDASSWVERSQQVIAKAEGLRSAAVDMETGVQGFLLAGEDTFLEPYEYGASSLSSDIADLKNMASANPSQLDKLAQIEDMISTWRRDVAQPAIELRRSIGDTPSTDDMARLMAEGPGAQQANAIKGLLDLFASRERALLEEREQAVVAVRAQLDTSLALSSSTQSSIEKSYGLIQQADTIVQSATRIIYNMDSASEDESLVRLQTQLGELQAALTDNLEQMEALIRIRTRLSQSDLTPPNDANGATTLDWITPAMQTFINREQTQLTRQQAELERVRVRLDSAVVDLESALQWVADTHKVLHAAAELEELILTLEIHTQAYLISGDSRALNALEPAHADALRKLDELLIAFSGDPSRLALLDDLKRSMRTWQQAGTASLVSLRSKINAESTIDDVARLASEAGGKSQLDRFRSSIAAFVATEQTLMADRQTTAEAANDQARVIVIAGIGLALLALLIVGLTLTRSLTHPMSMMVEALRQLGTGDLSSRVHLKMQGEIGEMAHAYNEATEKTSRTLVNLLRATGEIDIGTRKVSTTTNALASGVTEQVENAETVNEALQNISESTRETADTTSQAASLARESREAAERGHKEMTEMVDAMKGIESSSADISKILTDIDEIAFQTNLLSLNAAVEAARAGDAGRGFAVVAEEVRGLAQRSAAAARNSSTLIEQSNERSKRGVELAERVGEALDEISQRTGDVSVLMNQVESSSAQQTRSIEDVESGVRSLNAVTKKNADSTQQLAAAADTTSEQIARVRELVGHFQCE